MLNFLSTFKKGFALGVLGLCLALLLCPLQVRAAGDLEVTVKSPTDQDHVFTGEEVYDLTVYLQGKNAGTYYVSYRIIDSRKLVLVQSRTPIEITLSDSGYGELPLDLSSLKGRDTFRAEITVTDGSGATVGEASCTFGRTAVDSIVSNIANVRNGVLFSIDPALPNLSIYLKKEDRIPETVSVSYRIVNMDGQLLRQVKGQVTVPTKDYIAVPVNLYGLENCGMYRISYIVFDDTGYMRSSGSAYFQHRGSEYIAGSLHSAQNQPGLVFANDEPYDLVFSLRKTDGFPETFSMRYNVTDSAGNVVWESGNTLDVPAKDAVQFPLDLSDVTGYGVFTLTAAVTDQYGNEKELSFSFSRVLSTAQPGALPLVNINDHFTSNNGDPNLKLALSAQAGFGMWRCSIPWVSVERAPGNYSMPVSVEEVMQTTEALGMEALIILAYGNDELYGLPDPTKPGWLEAYANYCKYIAQYFGDRVNHYEIWNEWNHSSMGKTDPNRRGGNYYAMALAAASKAIKSVNPNAKIIGGAMAGHNEGWMVDMLSYDGNHDGKSDAMEAMDGFSFHAYNTDWVSCFYRPSEKDYYTGYDEVLAVLGRFGDTSDLEIWMTETGWSTAIGPGVTEEQQAAYFVQVHTWALANSNKVDRIFWYDLMNDRDAKTLDWDPAAGEHNWGLIHSWTNTGNEPLPYSAKRSYVAACAMTSMLADAQYVGTFQMGDDVQAYRFQKDGQDLLIAWMDQGSKTLTASFAGELVITDLYGNSVTYKDSAELTLSECPIYIAYPADANLSIG